MKWITSFMLLVSACCCFSVHSEISDHTANLISINFSDHLAKRNVFDLSSFGLPDTFPHLFYVRTADGQVSVAAYKGFDDNGIWFDLSDNIAKILSNKPRIETELMQSIEYSHKASTKINPSDYASGLTKSFKLGTLVSVLTKTPIGGYRNTILRINLLPQSASIINSIFPDARCFIEPSLFRFSSNGIAKNVILLLQNTSQKYQIDEDCVSQDRSIKPRSLSAVTAYDVLSTDRNMFMSVSGYVFSIPLSDFDERSTDDSRAVRTASEYLTALQQEARDVERKNLPCVEVNDCAQVLVNNAVRRLQK